MVDVGGDLVLDGTLDIAIPTGGAFNAGVYRLFNYGGTLTDNGLTIGLAPPSDLTVQTSVAHQVNLINTRGLVMRFWDGAAGPKNNSVVNGGLGTWQAASGNDNWTEDAGAANDGFIDAAFAVFQGAVGTVRVDDSLGAINVSGMQFASDGYIVEGDAINLAAAQTIVRVGDGTPAGSSMSALIESVLAGSGDLVKADEGMLMLSAANTYTGATIISSGTLWLDPGGSIEASSGLRVDGVFDLGPDEADPATIKTLTGSGAVALGTNNLIIAAASGQTFAGVIDGGAAVYLLTGAQTFSGDNTYDATFLVSASSVLTLGAGGTSGSILGEVEGLGTLAFNRSDTLTMGGVIHGDVSVRQFGSGVTELIADNYYLGSTTIDGGVLRIEGDQTDAIGLTSVNAGGTLGGSGIIGGDVTVANGGVLAPGSSPGTLTILGDLTLNSGSILEYELGEAGVVGGLLNDLTLVGGDLVLDGVLTVSVSAGGTYGPGVYRLISFDGALTDRGLSLGTLPAGGYNEIQTAIAGQVNLVNSLTPPSPGGGGGGSGGGDPEPSTPPSPLNFWDGNGGVADDGVISGGDGVWRAGGPSVWTRSDGAANGGFEKGVFAIFAAAPGAVRVDGAFGAPSVSGLQFASHGYRISGDPVALAAGWAVARVGDGTAAGAGFQATIASALTGAGGLDKTDLGTLTLTGANTYAGGTRISGGALQLGDGAAGGSILGDVVNDGVLAFKRSADFAFAGVLSGGG